MALLLLRASLVLLMAFSSSCTHTCETHGDVRLVGGLASSEGIVEICLNSQWGTVCGHSWDDDDASVVCQQLGYPTANYPYSGEHNGSEPIHLDDVYCNQDSHYDRLIDCSYSTLTSDCSHSDDVGVHCIATPGAPQNFIVSDVRNTSLTLSWQPSTETHGIEIQQYTAGCTSQYIITWTYRYPPFSPFSQFSATLNRLHPYTNHSCCVSALNIAGDGGFRECTDVLTLEDAPSAAPKNISGYASGSTSIYLSWSPPPLQHHNGRIRGYYIHVREVDTGTEIHRTSTGLQITIYQLHPYYTYECRVAAYTISEGTLSQPVNITTHQDVPTASPQRVSGSAIDSTSISLSWSPPPLPDQNGLIQYYSISVYEVATGTLTPYTTTNSPITIRSLHPFYTYRCSVAAYTTVGKGPQNQPPLSITTLQDIPTAAPQSVSGSAIDSTSISLSWSPPPLPDQNGLIQYSISVYEVATGTLTPYTSTNTQLTISSLHPYYTYQCRVAAYTIVGQGPQNQPVTIKTLQDIPSAPPENVITTEVSTTSVHLNWIPPPTKHHNGVITGYVARVTMANTQESYNILTSNTTELLVDSLTPDSEYIFAVAAQTVIGIGPFSGAITQQTKPTAPINIAIVAGAGAASLAVVATLLIATVVGYIGCRKLRNKQLRRNNDMNDDALDQRPGNAIRFKPHKCVQTALQGKDVKGKKKPRVALQNISFGVDQQTEVIDPIFKLQSLTFPVSKHMHAFLEQAENSQTLNTKDTTSFNEDEQPARIDPGFKLQSPTFCVSKHVHRFLEQSENSETLNTEDTAGFNDDEQPPPIPERLYLEQDDTPCVPHLYIDQQGVTRLQDFLVQERSQMTSPTSDRIYQPLLPPRQRKPEYEVTRSDSKCQDREQPIAAENKMNSPASDHIYQPLVPRRTAQQENAEYQSLRFKN